MGFNTTHFSFTTEKTSSLHMFPAVGREEQVNGVILQVLLPPQVGADQLPNLCGSVCRKDRRCKGCPKLLFGYPSLWGVGHAWEVGLTRAGFICLSWMG